MLFWKSASDTMAVAGLAGRGDDWAFYSSLPILMRVQFPNVTGACIRYPIQKLIFIGVFSSNDEKLTYATSAH